MVKRGCVVVIIAFFNSQLNRLASQNWQVNWQVFCFLDLLSFSIFWSFGHSLALICEATVAVSPFFRTRTSSCSWQGAIAIPRNDREQDAMPLSSPIACVRHCHHYPRTSTSTTSTNSGHRVKSNKKFANLANEGGEFDVKKGESRRRKSDKKVKVVKTGNWCKIDASDDHPIFEFVIWSCQNVRENCQRKFGGDNFCAHGIWPVQLQRYLNRSTPCQLKVSERW